jgi:hypothetical protein
MISPCISNNQLKQSINHFVFHRKETFFMTQQQTPQQPDHQKATNVAQDTSHSTFEKFDEEALRQITGGRLASLQQQQEVSNYNAKLMQQPLPTNTNGWRSEPLRAIGREMKTSPDGKFYAIDGKIRRNQVYQLH